MTKCNFVAKPLNLSCASETLLSMSFLVTLNEYLDIISASCLFCQCHRLQIIHHICPSATNHCWRSSPPNHPASPSSATSSFTVTPASLLSSLPSTDFHSSFLQRIPTPLLGFAHHMSQFWTFKAPFKNPYYHLYMPTFSSLSLPPSTPPPPPLVLSNSSIEFTPNTFTDTTLHIYLSPGLAVKVHWLLVICNGYTKTDVEKYQSSKKTLRKTCC